MMNGSPEDRLKIEQVKYTLLYIFENINTEISEIYLEIDDEQEIDINTNILRSLYFANNFLEEHKDLKERDDSYKTIDERIQCSLKSQYINLIILHGILENCKRKFEYEGNNTLKDAELKKKGCEGFCFDV